jgi:N-acetylglucosaminyl-diphospho-decaprenol L-rhamnosyltransferase
MSPPPDNPTKTVDVAIILIGINARDFVKGCLDSLLEAEWQGCTYEAVYVDNGSSDDTLDVLAKSYPWTRCIDNGKNLGFCRAANEAARTCDSRYYYFINDDTIVLKDAISMLVPYMDQNPEIATVGSRLLYPDYSEQYSGRGFPTLLSSFMGRRSPLTKLFPNAPWVRRYLCKDGLEKGAPFEADWVSAAGQIVRPKDFWAVGGFAENYYYWHEAIICSRMHRKGHKVVLHPQSKIIHYEGQGSGVRSYESQKFHIIDFHRGAYKCYREHHKIGKFHIAGLFVGTMLITRAMLQLGLAKFKTITN